MFARFDPNFGLFIGKFPANACATDEFLNARQFQLSYRRLLYKSRSRDNAINETKIPAAHCRATLLQYRDLFASRVATLLGKANTVHSVIAGLALLIIGYNIVIRCVLIER